MSEPSRGLVLIIDDDKKSVERFSFRLSKRGYAVIAAHDGAEGLEIATMRVPDVILLDVVLPVLDGHDVLAYLKRRAIPTRVVVWSAHAKSSDHITRLMRAGACDYVEKPTRIDELDEKIRRAIAVDPPLGGLDANESRVVELQAMVTKLQYESAELKRRVQEGEEALQAAKRASRWRQGVIRVVFLMLSLTTVLLLERLGVVPRGNITALVVAACVFLLLVLPLDRAVELGLDGSKLKGKVVMASHEDPPALQ